MKYDVMREYKQHMGVHGLTATTINTYFNKMDNLLEGQYFIESGKDIDLEQIFNKLSKITYKNYFSQNKNALMFFLEFSNIKLTKGQKTLINELESKTKKKYRNIEHKKYQKIKNTISRLKNKKLKLNFEVIIETGLRVSELSQIRIKDCIINDDYIHFSFVGKGGKRENACIYKGNNTPLYNDLEYLINEKCKNNKDTEIKMFYSSKYLQKKAKEYDFTCHDLRRISAKLVYKKTKSKKEVQEKLRHTKAKTTNVYLNSPIDMD